MAWSSVFRRVSRGKTVGTQRETIRLAADDSGSLRTMERTTDPKAGPVETEETQTLGPGGVIRHEEIRVRRRGGTSRYAVDFSARSVRVRYTRPGIRGEYESDAPPDPLRVFATPRMIAGLLRGGPPITLTGFSPRTGRWSTCRVTPDAREGGHPVLRRTWSTGSRGHDVLDADLRTLSVGWSTGDVFVRTALHPEPTTRTHARSRGADLLVGNTGRLC